MRPACASLDAAALRHNLESVRRHAPSTRIMAVIKANGYGHGLVFVAETLSRADGFGVASLEEGLELRAAGITQTICLLEGFFDTAELPLIVKFGLTPVIHDEHQLVALREFRSPQRLSVWVKIDTGMHRLGFPPAAARPVVAALRAVPYIATIGLLSHLACADDVRSTETERQISLLSECYTDNIEKSLANSAAILRSLASHGSWVRPGLMLYGASPLPPVFGPALGLAPVMTLKSRIISVRRRAAGDRIGYGGDYRCPVAMPVGIVAIGYGDGYPRELATGTPVLIKGQRVPIIGRVSMDMLSVDLRTVPAAAVDDEVILWGQGLPVEEIAAAAGTIPYTLLCGLTQRLPRRVIP